MLPALLALLLVSGCSSFEIAYELADVYIEGQVSDYLDLSEADEAHLEKQVKAMMAWHKAEMLPRYAAHLRQAADNVEGRRMDRATVNQGIGDFRVLLDDTVRGVARYAGPILARHTAEPKRRHLALMMRKYDPDRRPRGAKPLTDEQARDLYIDERSGRIMDHFERFAGPLRSRLTARFQL